MNYIYNEISKNNLFHSISSHEINTLLHQINYQHLHYSKDGLIITAGETCNYLLLLLEGSVRGEMVDFAGKILKIEDISSGKPLAIAFLFGKQNKFPVNIIANSEVSLIRIWREDLLKILQQNQQLLTNYLNLISNRAQFLSEKIKFLSFSTIKEKFIQYILKLGATHGKAIELKQTQQEIADLFGVARPSLARAIKELENEGAISITKKVLTVKNSNLFNP